jgi:UDP-N-acetylmuramoyl-L-alanyl-D-glutamate--2,6-diaminopimelate ligase
MEIDLFGRRHTVLLGLPGEFQASNVLCALGLVIACGDNADKALAALASLEGVPGRVQLVARRANGAPVYVDYAHTPDALSHVLSALRPHTEKRLVVAFGCGGDRDRGKRPEMGSIAARLADTVIVTDDNPRGEDAAAIRQKILATCPDATEIGDRAEAIHGAAAVLEAGDVLVIAGKGHEQGQIVGPNVLPFDDAEVARAAVAAIDGQGT